MEDEQSSDDVPAWVPLYTCLVILLVAFFIMMVAYSTFDSERTRVAIGSLRGTFGVLGGGFSLIRGDETPFSPKKRKSEEKSSESLLEKLNAFVRFCKAKRGIRVHYNSSGLRIDTAERLLFDTGSTKLNKESEPLLKLLANILSQTGSRVVVEGHCDKEDLRLSRYRSGWELSLERALAVTRYLVRHGVDPHKISSYGYSLFNPLYTGQKQVRFNRRVTLLIDLKGADKMIESRDEDGQQESEGTG